MSNLEILPLVILAMFTGVAVYKAGLMFQYTKDLKRRAKDYPSVLKVKDPESELCKGPHKWDRIKLALGNLPVDTYMVCTECGYISHEGSDHRLNGPGLEVYRNNLKRREERIKRWEAAFKQKQEESHNIMNRLIKTHVGELNDDLQHNIEVLQQFFRKANIELDSLYSTLNKKLDEEDNRG